MAATNSYQDLIDRIKNELQRNDSDIETIITNAISDAIRHFKDECFAVNQASYYISVPAMDSSKLTTNPMDGAYVKLPDDFNSMVSLKVNNSGTLYEMDQITYPEIDEMDAMYSDPVTGVPQYWSYFGEIKGAGSSGTPTGPAKTDEESKYTPGQIRIFRRPDKAYTLIMRYVSNLEDPAVMTGTVVDDQGNTTPTPFNQRYGFWMNEASRMIKAYAKGIIYADYLQQYDQAQAQEVMAQSEFNRLVGRSEARAFENDVIGYL
jgi:hypothetical protein